jgi:hypothetical protein
MFWHAPLESWSKARYEQGVVMCENEFNSTAVGKEVNVLIKYQHQEIILNIWRSHD